MRAWIWLALGIVACSGDQSTSGPTDSNGGATTDAGSTYDPNDPLGCNALPTYDLDGLDCQSTWTALDQLSREASKCFTKDDCWLAKPDCTHWVQATCFLVVNTCLTQSLLSEFDAAGYGCQGDDPQDQCTCPGDPNYDCLNGICGIVYE